MKVISFLLLVGAIGVQSLDCPDGQLACGPVLCYDPTTHGCDGNEGVIQCRNSCNGICYGNTQFCYNNTLICNNNDLVCDIQYYSASDGFSTRPACYDPSWVTCLNTTLCLNYLTCGTQCITDYNVACANNQTICPGYDAHLYYDFYKDRLDVCGPQQQCYDKAGGVCLGDNGIICPIGNQLCSELCYNPDLQICANDTLQCLNSCNGTCYWNTQFCYNNTLICNNNDLVCDIQYYSASDGFSTRPACYDPSWDTCLNGTLCQNYLTCGTQCITDYNVACANNQTICPGYDAHLYYDFYKDRLDVCGPQQQCYDKAGGVCLGDNGIICPIGNQLCSELCYNPDLQICANDTLQCLNSCNGTCYWNTQFCYNNTLICNNNDLVCDIQYYSASDGFSTRPACYDPSWVTCLNTTLCLNYLTCGTQCITDYNSACANNQTICPGYDAHLYYDFYKDRLDVCGPQQQCYDKAGGVCLGDNGIICPIGNQLCSGLCYDPQLQYCASGNNTIYCLNNPLEDICLTTTTQITSTSESSSTATMTTTPPLPTTTTTTTIATTTTTPPLPTTTTTTIVTTTTTPPLPTTTTTIIVTTTTTPPLPTTITTTIVTTTTTPPLPTTTTTIVTTTTTPPLPTTTTTIATTTTTTTTTTNNNNNNNNQQQ